MLWTIHGAAKLFEQHGTHPSEGKNAAVATQSKGIQQRRGSSLVCFILLKGGVYGALKVAWTEESTEWLLTSEECQVCSRNGVLNPSSNRKMRACQSNGLRRTSNKYTMEIGDVITYPSKHANPPSEEALKS